MSVLVYAENDLGKFKKATYELVAYGKAVAEKLNKELYVTTIGNVEADEIKKLGNYGAGTVYHINNDQVSEYKAEVYTEALHQLGEKVSAEVFLLTGGLNSRPLASRLSARLDAGLVTGAVDLPDTSDGFVVKKSAFSGKGFAHTAIHSEKKIISPAINSFGAEETGNPSEPAVESFEPSLDSVNITYEVKEVKKEKGVTPLPDCDIVVSGGRGLKGPENWHLIEKLAEALDAGMACSKPVSDMEWRPHHEHVGQTGTTISPNLYIAIGISGAVQHLAGVNSSKVIVAINKDPEAPFFKAADYGIVGDAFEVVPKLIEAAQKQKEAS